MDDGSDLAIISGSGKLPFLIKNAYKKAIDVTFTDSEKATENKIKTNLFILKKVY